MKDILQLFSLKDKNTNRNDFLKVVAIIVMTIDHVGQVFFPHCILLRIIGRLAMPIFALGIANGYQYTSNFKKYLFRIIIVGLISQIPYALLFETVELNILFLFFVSLGTIYMLDKKIYLGIVPLFAILYLFPIDYGWYGVIMILLFYFFKEKRLSLLTSLGVLIAIYSYIKNPLVVPFQMLGVFLVVYLPVNFCKIKMPRNIFYWFYPVHLIILLIIKTLL